jgi:hypothetical protein
LAATSSSDEFLFDAWTPMSFKRALGTRRTPGTSYQMPDWVGEHRRRLQAYKILQSYVDNSARLFLAEFDLYKREQHREYGDAALIRDTIRAAVLGEDQTVTVPGAEDYNPDADPGDGTTGDDPAEATADKAAWEFQDWLRTQFFEVERGRLKMLEVERNAVGLGDGVYTLGWDEVKQRVRVRVWDPGFYFPCLDDGNEDDFPECVHLAWELPPEPGATETKARVRRLTWRLGPILPAQRGSGVLDRLFRKGDVLHDGDAVGPDGGIQRSYPWNGKPSEVTCYYSDGVWQYEPGGRRTVEQFDPAAAKWATGPDGQPVRDVDLAIDFVPVVHLPNTVAIADHYGRSSLATVLQVLDDLAATDTDIQAAGATAAKPIMALEGGTLGRRAASYNPGEVWETGTGKLSLIDTSKALDALLALDDKLQSRLASNARTPEALLGKVKPSEVPSGVAVAFSFGPLSAMVEEMRLSRGEKYPLLFKFFWRMATAGGQDGVPPQYYPATLEMGAYLPRDQAAAAELVAKLRAPNGPTGTPSISLETAVRILIAAGYSIEDANEEVRRIEESDFAGADALLTATADEDAVFAYLGRDKPPGTVRPPPPPVNLPPPGAPPGAPVPPAPGPPGAPGG